jgi:NADH:ubiquinone oxidoreductase subunit E
MMENDNLGTIFSKYPPNKKDGLLPLLQEIQNSVGHLTEESLAEVSRHLSLPANKVYGVATFYNHFRLHSQGHYHIRLCRGTACHIYGSSTYLEELENKLRLKAGNTSKDHKFSLEISNCMGACEYAPILYVNDIIYTHVKPGDLENIIRSLKEKTI